MPSSKSQDKTDHLKILGQGGETTYVQEGPHAGIMETFPNNFPERPYIVSIEFPEYTSLCPKASSCTCLPTGITNRLWKPSPTRFSRT
jgi:NADPH-dependent 7-cyano-7-deazaguanine reductase QueF